MHSAPISHLDGTYNNYGKDLGRGKVEKGANFLSFSFSFGRNFHLDIFISIVEEPLFFIRDEGEKVASFIRFVVKRNSAEYKFRLSDLNVWIGKGKGHLANQDT